MISEDNICKICHSGDTEEEKLVYPCKCTGSIKYTHKSCLFQFIKSSGKEYCTICKHKYTFKDIYKENTPDRLPLKLIFRDAFYKFKYHVVTICKNSLIIFITFLTVGVNGIMFLHLLGLPFSEALESSALAVFTGLIVSVISYLFYYLFDRVSRASRTRLLRRTLRIDSLSVMSSMASEALSQGREEVIPNVIPQQNPEMSTEESEVTAPDTVIEIIIDYKFLPKCCNFIFPLTLFFKVAKYLSFDFPNCSFTRFLREICLYELTKIFTVFYLLFFISILLTKRWRKIYEFLKMINLICVCSAIIIFIDGVCIHFLFSEITGNGVIYNFSNSIISFIFHMALGYGFNSFFKDYILLYSTRFRPGLIWTLAEPSNGSFDFLYKLSQRSLYVTYTKTLRNCFFHLSAFGLLLKIISPEILRKLFIADTYTLIILFRSKSVFSGAFENFLNTIVYVNSHVIKFISRFLEMQNYLFNEPVKNIENRENLFKWCPNSHKFYDLNTVRRKYKKKVDLLDVEKLYLKKHTKDFGVFFIPEKCQLYINLLSFYIVISTGFAFRIMLRITREATKLILNRFPVLNLYDVYVYLFITLLLSFSMIIPSDIRVLKNIPKKVLIFIHINLFYPLWVSFIVIVLYGNEYLTVIPSTIFMTMFIISDILKFIIYRIVLTVPIENYAYRYILRVLYSITVSSTVMICLVRYSQPLFSFGIRNTIKLPLPYLFIIFISYLILSGQITRSYKNFVESVRRNNFLVDREVMNYDS